MVLSPQFYLVTYKKIPNIVHDVIYNQTKGQFLAEGNAGRKLQEHIFCHSVTIISRSFLSEKDIIIQMKNLCKTRFFIVFISLDLFVVAAGP